MTTVQEFLGAGRSFDRCDSIDAQPIIQFGYKNCTRRTYLIRFEWKDDVTPESRLESFAKNGVVAHPKRRRIDLCCALMKLAQKKQEEVGYFVDIAFTFAGLQKIEVKEELLNVFRRKSPAFTDNAVVRSQRHLGDTGLSDVSFWDEIYRDDSIDSGIHLVISANFPWKLEPRGKIPAENDGLISLFEKYLWSLALMDDPITMPSRLLSGSWIEVSVPPNKQGIEHFGFQDGLTAPHYTNKNPTQKQAHKTEHALGEILLGHPRNDGDNLYSQLDIPLRRNPFIDLQSIPNNEKNFKFFANSSFAVIRKIEQDTQAFDQWLDAQSKKYFLNDQQSNLIGGLTADAYEKRKIWIKSKLLGRTPNGKMLKPSMSERMIVANGPLDKVDENLGFKRLDSSGEPITGDDSRGHGCPFSSHIRRMNPRDDPVTPFIHRPLLRRGISYQQDQSKGLLGLFFCADLVEQFEHLVGAWAQDRVLGIPDTSDCRDPLIGNHEQQRNTLELTLHTYQQARSIELKFDKPFVRTRGCAYLWFPSITTLKDLHKYFVKIKS